jgi:hypothetical protein
VRPEGLGKFKNSPHGVYRKEIIRIYKKCTIFRVLSYGWKTWSLALREEHKTESV